MGTQCKYLIERNECRSFTTFIRINSNDHEREKEKDGKDREKKIDICVMEHEGIKYIFISLGKIYV